MRVAQMHLYFCFLREKNHKKLITNGGENSLGEMDRNSFTYYVSNVIYLSPQEPLEEYYKYIAARKKKKTYLRNSSSS